MAPSPCRGATGSTTASGLGDPESVRIRADQFALLADPTRLTLLTCIRAAGPISVFDLAAATGIHDTTVSQALRASRSAAGHARPACSIAALPGGRGPGTSVRLTGPDPGGLARS